jgi:RNA polymerase-binding transcription factor DksA
MLASSDLEHIRLTLEMERVNLLQSIEDQMVVDLLEDNPDEEDLADFVVHHEIRSSLDQLNEGTLGRIDRALERLAAGTYGECLSCRGEIPNERLLALPYAEMCVGCQSRSEKRSGWVQ